MPRLCHKSSFTIKVLYFFIFTIFFEMLKEMIQEVGVEGLDPPLTTSVFLLPRYLYHEFIFRQCLMI